jgi:hypothetical protein
MFFRFARDRWSYHMNLGKGVAGVTAVEGVTLMIIAAWIDMYFGQRLLLSIGKWPVGIASIALFFFNFYALVKRGHGTQFEREFSHLNKQRKKSLLVVFWLLFLAVMAFLYYSIYAYQHFFHIVPKGW